MKSKTIKLIAVLFLLFFGFSAESQSYKPMLSQFNEWHLTNCFSGCSTDIYFTNADTVVNGFTYSILDGFHYISRTFLLRESIEDKQVFLMLTGGSKGNVEYLLYDFSLQLGDSMLVYNPISPLPDSAGYYAVDSIIPKILIDGDVYRHFYLSASDSIQSQSATTEWIEGIGSLSLINTPGGVPKINSYGALSCFFNNLTLHYSNLDSIDGCVQVHTDLGINEFNKLAEFSVFPNPASHQIVISSQTRNIRSIEIYNILGRVVERTLVENTNADVNMSTEFLKPGYYIIKIITEDNKHLSSKLVIN